MEKMYTLFIVLAVAIVAMFGLSLNGCSEDLAGEAVGLFVESPSEEICDDSDGGIIPDEAGVVLMRNGSIEYVDACASEDTLKEYYCAKPSEDQFKVIDCGEYGLNSFGVEYVCEDGACVVPSSESNCSDLVDNDMDGDKDCDDSDCASDSACVVSAESDCADGVDNDVDGDIDCLDEDCDGVDDCEYNTELTCDDGFDNDDDWDTDCDDSDCDLLSCDTASLCYDGSCVTECIDNADGSVSYYSSSSEDFITPPAICDIAYSMRMVYYCEEDGSPGDTFEDCPDGTHCNDNEDIAYCYEYDCDDGIDNDEDGDADCADDDCDRYNCDGTDHICYEGSCAAECEDDGETLTVYSTSTRSFSTINKYECDALSTGLDTFYCTDDGGYAFDHEPCPNIFCRYDDDGLAYCE